MSAITTPNTVAKPYRVTLHKDSQIEYPEMYMDVFVAGDHIEQRAFAEMFIRSKCKRAPSPEKADLVVFTGGDDVNPILYGESPHSTTRFNSKRDEQDIALYELCYNLGIPMIGVCRGAQFLHVMNGGKLIQDLDNHQKAHRLWDFDENRLVLGVSSVHHQACLPNKEGGMHLIADVMLSRNRWLNPTDFDDGLKGDVEAFFYRDTHCLGFQGHPEYRGFDEYRQWCLNKILKYIVESPDLETFTDEKGTRFRRIQKAFLQERDSRYKARDEAAKVEMH